MRARKTILATSLATAVLLGLMGANSHNGERSTAIGAPAIEVQSGDRPAVTYVGIRSTPDLPIADLEKFYTENAPKLFEALGKANVKPEGPLCGLYFDWNEHKQTTSLMVCVPVAKGTQVGGLGTETIPAGKAYWTVLNGPYEGMFDAHTAINTKITADNMDFNGPVLEEYIVGPPEPDLTKFITKIIYPVKPKS